MSRIAGSIDIVGSRCAQSSLSSMLAALLVSKERCAGMESSERDALSWCG